MLTLEQLRLRHPTFFFDRVDVQHLSEKNELELRFFYHFENGPEFTTAYVFPKVSTELFAKLDLQLLHYWATQIGMVEGLSYWKLACSPRWVVNAPGISQSQVSFWDTLLKKGLSEFFFIHQIDAWQSDFVKFEVGEEITVPKDTTSHAQRLLIPVGGGKDSIVTTELLKDTHLPMTTFSVNMYPQLQKVLEVFWSGKVSENHIQVSRTLDPQLIELNQQGYLNGHTPFSAMVAFVSTFTAYLYDYTYVPLSNEWSANEGNTIFLGQTINHQYSKTVEFEQLFREYQQQYLSSTIEYFSFLRPLHELQIAELFTKQPQYFPVFLSCNVGQKRGEWCGECPKCLFVALMLSAFLSNEQLTAIFKKDILNNMQLKDIFDQLVGFTEVKSLECVGTRLESQAAVTLAAKHLSPLPQLIDYGWEKLRETQSEEELGTQADLLRKGLATQHFIPSAFREILTTQVAKNIS